MNGPVINRTIERLMVVVSLLPLVCVGALLFALFVLRVNPEESGLWILSLAGLVLAGGSFGWVIRHFVIAEPKGVVGCLSALLLAANAVVVFFFLFALQNLPHLNQM